MDAASDLFEQVANEFVYCAYIRKGDPKLTIFALATKVLEDDQWRLRFCVQNGSLCFLAQWGLAIRLLETGATVISIDKVAHAEVQESVGYVNSPETQIETTEVFNLRARRPRSGAGAAPDQAGDEARRLEDGFQAVAPMLGKTAKMKEQLAQCTAGGGGEDDGDTDGGRESCAATGSESRTASDVDLGSDAELQSAPAAVPEVAEPVPSSAPEAAMHVFLWITRTSRRATCCSCKGHIGPWEPRLLWHPDPATVADKRRWGTAWWTYFHIAGECVLSSPARPEHLANMRVDFVRRAAEADDAFLQAMQTAEAEARALIDRADGIRGTRAS